MDKKINIDYEKTMSATKKEPSLAKIIFHPFPYGVKSLIPFYNSYKVIEVLTKKVIDSATLTSDNNVENIKELIKSGKINNVDEMNININKDTGIDIGADLSAIDIPGNIKFKVGAKGETIINVKYKS